MTTPTRPHVMLVDDEDIFLKMGKVLAEAAGVEMTLVDSGRVAVETAIARRFDLILMDVSMPTVDGPGATATIRKIETESGLPRTPIVALTSHVPGRIRAAMKKVGMDEVVAKPIDLETLQALLARDFTPVGEESDRTPGKSIDLTDLQRLAVTDRDMKELLDAFCEGIASSRRLMEKGIAARDKADCLRAAHSLKGLYAQVGAKAGSRLMEEIESLVREGGIDGVAPLWSASEEDRKMIAKAVDDYRAERGFVAG